MPTLNRIGFIGEIFDPTGDIIVVDDNQAEFDPQLSTVHLRVLARIALNGFVEDGHREGGFRGNWQSADSPDAEHIPVLVLGTEGFAGSLRVFADRDVPGDAANDDTVRTRDGHRYYMETETPEVDEAAA